MINAKILRGKSSDQGTPGSLIWFTYRTGILELPWLDNQPEVSCIPAGSYRVEWTLSPRLHRYTYEIQNVPRRGGIRLHSGNFAGARIKGFRSDSLGCPLLCRYFGTINGQLAGLASRPAVSQLELTLNKRPFNLELIWISEAF